MLEFYGETVEHFGLRGGICNEVMCTRDYSPIGDADHPNGNDQGAKIYKLQQLLV